MILEERHVQPDLGLTKARCPRPRLMAFSRLDSRQRCTQNFDSRALLGLPSGSVLASTNVRDKEAGLFLFRSPRLSKNAANDRSRKRECRCSFHTKHGTRRADCDCTSESAQFVSRGLLRTAPRHDSGIYVPLSSKKLPQSTLGVGSGVGSGLGDPHKGPGKKHDDVKENKDSNRRGQRERKTFHRARKVDIPSQSSFIQRIRSHRHKGLTEARKNLFACLCIAQHYV
jgi:hypothetical protein